MALAGLQHVLVKAAHSARTVTASISRLSLDTGLARDPATGAGRAEAVEQCQCPPGYRGLSCEACAPGHTRAGRGLYLGYCEPCQCGGKSASCDPETGTCLVMGSLAALPSTFAIVPLLQNCRDFTAGDHCEDCRAGYVRDGRGGCVPASDTAGDPCTCDPRGSLAPGAPCPEPGGQCECRAGAEGRRCDRCGPGTFGVAGSCAACYCSGVTEECGEAALYWSTLRMPLVSSDHGFTLTDKGLGINKTLPFLAIF